MVRKQEKSINKLNRKRWWLTIPLFVLILCCMFQLFILGMKRVVYYIMERSLQSEYERICDLADLYMYWEKNGDESVRNYLDTVDREWIILDADRKQIAGPENHTCEQEYCEMTQMDAVSSVMVHEDMENKTVYIKNGRIRIDFHKFMKGLKDVLYDENDDEDLDHLFEENEKEWEEEYERRQSLRLNQDLKDNLYSPVWAEIPLDDGSFFVAKIYFQINVGDLIVVLIIAGIVLLIIIFVFFYLLIRAIRNRRRQKKMMTLYYTDEVTGGNNWKWFHHYGEAYLKKKKTAAKDFALLDIDFVKYRNYCICHSVEDGETVLRRLIEIIEKNIGKKEMCAHYGSANFAVLLMCQSEEELMQRTDDLVKKLEGAAPGRRLRFHVGIDRIPASLKDDGRPAKRKTVDLDKAYNNACTARATLAVSDESGIQIFDDKLVKEQKWTSLVQEKQERAIQNEQFVVYYQPKYDPRTNKLSGAEALIRWNSPSLGFLSPGRFIPIFEANGFITEIDHYMIRHVAADQKKWLDEGYGLVPVSVNVSRAHFAESDLAEQIRDMVDEAGTPHKYIEIELTESAFFDDKTALISTIKKLKEYGFTVSMDDFGSGYSSLNSLKDMPLDVLKLDAEFFRGDFDDTRGEVVVSEAIRLAQNLHMRTVAEGVEVREQVEFLAKQGCDMIQGYYYAKPMPGEDYEERMRMGVMDPEAKPEEEAQPEEEPVADIPEEEAPASTEDASEAEVPEEEAPEEEEPAEESDRLRKMMQRFDEKE